ncbi:MULTISPECIES: DUF3040 domain-containing protein [Nonomuraea]|uniref:DUF3040 domain-containing protein n=1 Tax=Nonomuraea TaxID=83681 RepID=UPI001CD96612|nr:DUF3040 domain-containing protein [Nonomuraea aurantiaca]MCA2221113.1 DUF3040 domain-containing protein [Nonomuraea aurantiaca]
MSLSGRERRILGEIEQALELEDPDMARRVAAINKIETGSDAGAYRERMQSWAGAHIWLIALLGVIAVLLLVLAVITA